MEKEGNNWLRHEKDRKKINIVKKIDNIMVPNLYIIQKKKDGIMNLTIYPHYLSFVKGYYI